MDTGINSNNNDVDVFSEIEVPEDQCRQSVDLLRRISHEASISDLPMSRGVYFNLVSCDPAVFKKFYNNASASDFDASADFHKFFLRTESYQQSCINHFMTMEQFKKLPDYGYYAPVLTKTPWMGVYTAVVFPSESTCNDGSVVGFVDSVNSTYRGEKHTAIDESQTLELNSYAINYTVGKAAHIVSSVLRSTGKINGKIMLNIDQPRSTPSPQVYSSVGAYQVSFNKTPASMSESGQISHDTCHFTNYPRVELLGVSLNERNQVHMYSSMEDTRAGPEPIMVMIDNIIMAQVFPNGIYFYIDPITHLPEGRTSKSFEILRKMVRMCEPAILAFANGDTQEIDRLKEEARSKFIVDEGDQFQELLNSAMPLLNRSNKDELQKIEKEIKEIEKALISKRRSACGLRESLGSTNQSSIDLLKADLEAMQTGAHAGIKFASIGDPTLTPVRVRAGDTNSSLVIITDCIVANNRGTKGKNIIGCLMITLKLHSNECRVYVKNLSRSSSRGSRAAPHVSESGDVCFGNISYEIGSYLSNFKIGPVVGLLLSFFQDGVDPSDDWGKYINYFPEWTQELEDEDNFNGDRTVKSYIITRHGTGSDVFKNSRPVQRLKALEDKQIQEAANIEQVSTEQASTEQAAF